MLREQGITPTAELIDRLVTLYREHDPAIALEPDARTFIERQRNGRALAIVSDGFLAAQRAKVRALGVDRGHISPIVLTDGYGRDWWKPNVRGFCHVQAQFALPSSRFVYVADNPAKDFVAPLELGWKTVRIGRHGGLHRHIACNPPVDLEIESLDELTESLLDGLLGSGQESESYP